jgi:hypothetical protein
MSFVIIDKRGSHRLLRRGERLMRGETLVAERELVIQLRGGGFRLEKL